MNQYAKNDEPLLCDYETDYWVCCMPSHQEIPDRHYMIEKPDARLHVS